MTSTPHDELVAVLYDLAISMIRRRPRDLSLTAASVLNVLERRGPVRLGDLAANEAVTQPGMTATVNELSNMGLVERTPDSVDGRVVLVRLTATGEAFLASRRQLVATWVATAMAQFSTRDKRAIERAVPHFRQLEDALAKEASPEA